MMEFQESSMVKVEISEITGFMVYMFKKIIVLFEFLSALVVKRGKGHDSILGFLLITYYKTL